MAAAPIYVPDTLKNTTSVHLGDVTNVVKGKLDNSVQGDFAMDAKGSARFSSQHTFTMAAPNVNMTSEDLTLVGAGGTIGGENTIYYGKNYFGKSARKASHHSASVREQLKLAH